MFGVQLNNKISITISAVDSTHVIYFHYDYLKLTENVEVREMFIATATNVQ